MKLSTILPLATFTAFAAAGPFTYTCRDITMTDKYLRASCADNSGKFWRNEQNMNLCLANASGTLQWQDNGGAFASCYVESFDPRTTIGIVRCAAQTQMWGTVYVRNEFRMDARVENLNGYLWCYGHRSKRL